MIPMFFTFDMAGALGSPAVLTQGASGWDFVDAGTGSCKAYTADQTCRVNVTFTPRSAGTRKGVVVLYSSKGNVVATGNLQGFGVGPEINLLPAIQSALQFSSLSASIGQVAADGSGNV